jgi:hypothetical protein
MNRDVNNGTRTQHVASCKRELNEIAGREGATRIQPNNQPASQSAVRPNLKHLSACQHRSQTLT